MYRKFTTSKFIKNIYVKYYLFKNKKIYYFMEGGEIKWIVI